MPRSLCRRWTVGCLVALPLALALAVAPPAAAQPNVDGLADLVEKLLPSVVNISMYDLRKPQAGQPAPNPPEVRRKFGTGFIVHETGIVVTNKHVTQDGILYTVALPDGRQFRARLIAEAAGIDIAVMKIESDQIFPTLRIGDSDKLRRGDGVIAIGNPLGWSSSVSTGIISALDRSIGYGATDNFIQTDAAINQGNSGGPLFNTAGEVIGINAAILTTSDDGGNVGIGFAIPVNDAVFVLQQLLKYGEVRLGWIGVEGESVTAELAATLGMTGVPVGVILSTVSPGSPAATAGLRLGDVILEYDGKAQRNIRALRRSVAQTVAGARVPVLVLRDGKQMTIEVVAADHPNSAALQGRTGTAGPVVQLSADLGLTLAAQTDELRAQHKIPAGRDGVVVADVVRNSPAWVRGVRPGDVIMMVQGDAVQTPADVRGLITAAREANQPIVRMLLNGADGARWVAILVATTL